ncbi:Kinesin-like protein KIP3, partial [Diplonema papillatum]
MQKKKHDARTGPEEGATERMFVVVRVRGLTERERQLCSLRYPHRLHAGYKCVECTPTEVIASDPDTPESSDSRRHYAFDRVFDAAATNLDIYNATVRPMLPGLLEGFNATCFAYGMTGAGKTYTMMGADRVKGLCYMAVEDLFPLVRESDGTSAVHASYLEIYNEKIKDLLGNDEDRRHDIIEDPVRGVVVTELAEYRVSTLQDLYTLMALGCEKRTRASTVSNVVSSRSHAILLITVKRERGKLGLDAGGGGAAGASKQVSVGKLALIDLAGSERALPGESKRGDRLREGANINRSLLALGNCITILGSAKAGEKRHVPYRDSKLTRLLKDALGGNTRTVMIGNTSPSSTCYEEVISTLKYATRARSITRCVTRNALVVPDKLAKGAEHPLLETIRADIEQLQTRLIMRTCERDGICHPRPLLSPATRFTPHPVLSSRKPPTAADPPAGTASRAADSNPESTKQRSATSPADVPLVSAPRPGQASRHRHPSASLQLQLQLPPGGAGGASGRSDSKMRRSATAPAGAQLSAEPAGVQADGRQPGGVSPRAAGPHPGHYPANAQPSGAPGVQAEVQHHLQPAVASGVSLRAAGSHPVHSAANVQLVGITGVQAEVQQLLQPASGKLAASAGPHPVLDSPAAVPRVRRRSGGLDTDDDDDDGGSGGEGGSDGSPASTKRGGGGAAANRDDAPSKAAAAAGGGGRCERPGADDYGESCSNRVSTKRGGGGGAAAKREAEDTPPEPGLAAPAAAGGRGAEYDDGDSGCSSRVSTQQGGDTSGRGSRQPPSPAGSNSSSEASRSTAHTQVPGTGRGGAAAAANTLSGNPGSSPFRPDCAAGADRGTPAEAAAGVAATAGAAADTRVLPLAFSPVGGHHGSSPFRSSCAADAGRGTPTEAAAGVAATTADTRALPLAFSPAGGNPGSSPFRPNFADGGTEAAGVVAAALPLRGSPPPRPKGAARSLTAPAARSQRGAADPVSCALGPAILRCRAAASHLAGVASSAAGSPCLTPQETAPGGSPCLGPQAAAPSGSPWLAPQETAPGGSPCLTPQETAPGGSPCLGPQAAAPGGSPCLTPQETAPGGSPCLGPQAAAPSGSTWLAPQETAPGGSPCLAPQAAAAAKGSSQLVDTTLEPHRESSHISLDQLSSETREYPNRRDEGPVGSPGHGPANNLENEREIERTNSVDKHGPGSVGFPDGVPAGCRVEYLEIDIQAEMECINHQPTEPVCPPRGRVRDGAGRGKANGFPPPNRDQSYESNADAHGSRETGADAFSTQLCEGAWMHGLDRLQDGVGRGYANVFPPPTDQSYEGDEARADAFSKHLQAARPQGLDRLRDDMGRGSVNVFNPQPRDQPYGSDDDAQCSRETGTDASSTHVHQGTRPQGLDRQQDDVRRGSVNVFHPPPRDQQSDDDTQCSREPGADAFATHPQEEARPQGLDGLRADAGRGSVNVFPPPTEQLYEINADAHSAPPSGKVQPQRRDDIARREAECALPGDQSYESSAPEDVQPQHAWRQVDREAHVDSFLLHEEAHLSHAAIQLHAQEPWCEEASYNASERTHLNGFSRKGGASHANVRRQPEDENPAVRGDDDPQLSRGSRRLREAVPLARRDQRERTEVPHHHQLDEDDGSYGLAAALSYEGQPAEPLQTASTHGGGGPSSPCNPTAPAAATATGDPPRLDLVGNLLRLPLALRDKSRACGSADGAPPYPAAAPKDREMQRLKEVLVRFGKSVGDVGDADTPSDWSDVREHADAGLDGSQRLRDRVPAAEAYSSLGAVACAPSPRARRRAHTCRPPPPLPSPGAWGTQSCNQPAKSPTLFPYSSRPRDTDASVDSALGWVKATSPRTRHLDATCELIDAPHAPEDSAGSAGPRGANGGTRLGGFPQGEGGAAPPPGAPRGGAVEGSRQRASSAPGCSGSERLLLRLRGAAARPGGRHGARRGCAGQAQGQPASEPPGKRPRHPQALRQQQQQQLVLLPQGGQQRAGRPQPGRQPQPLQQQREPERPEHRSQPQQQLGVQLQQQQRHLTCAQKQQQQQQQEPERPEHRSQPQQQLGVQQQQQHPTCAQKQQQQEPERPEHRSQPQQQLGVQQQQQQQRRLTRAQKQQQEPERPEHRNQPQQLLGGQQWAGRRQPGPQPQQQQQQPLLQEPKRLQHRNQPQQLAQQRAGRQQSVQQPQFHQQQQQQQEPERPQPHSQLQPQRHAARQLLQQQQQQRKRPQNQHPLQPYLERLQLRQQREQEQQGLQRQPHPRRQPPSQQQQPKARERRPTPTQSQRQGDLPLDVQQQPHLSDQLSLQQQQQPQARERHQMQVQRQGDHLQNVQQPHLSDQLSLQQQQQPKARERCQTPTQPQQRQEDLLHHVQHPHDSGQPEQRGGREQCQRELQKGQPPACRPRDGREHEQHAERLPHRDQGEGQAPEELQQHTAHRLPHRDQLTRRPDHRQQGEGPTPEELQQHTAQRVPHRDQVQSPHQAHRPDHRQQGEGQAPEELQQHATQRFIHQDQLAHQPESRQQGEAQQDRVRQQPQVPQNGWQVQPHPEREADARRFQGGVRHEPPHEHVHRHLQQQPQPGERWDWHQPSQPARAAGRSESPSDIPRALGSAFGNVLRRSAQQLPAGSGSRRRHQHHQEGWRTLPHDDPAFHDDESTLTLSCAASPSERGCASAEVSSSAGAKEPAAAHTAFTVSPKVSPQGFDDGCGDPHAERDPDGRFPAPHGHSAGAKKPAAADTAFTVTPRHPGSPTAPPQGFDEGCG